MFLRVIKFISNPKSLIGGFRLLQRGALMRRQNAPPLGEGEEVNDNMKKMAVTVGVGLLVTLLLNSCTGVPEGLEPVTGFEPNRYLGTWYEIARLDHSFERNLINVTAHYSRKESGEIVVVNKGFNRKTGEWKEIKGHARFIENESVGSLKVSFFGPFYGGYHIIVLDKENYAYTMVAGPNRSYLWILARDKTLNPETLSDLVSRAKQWGFDTENLIYVEQN
jgi:apolipoprotein D and lipocalin family protein